MTIQLINDLPRDIEIQTCTCRLRRDWDGNYKFSEEWRRPIHGTCGKPTQDEVIYECANCEEYFISKTLHPSTNINNKYFIQSVIYIARAKSGSESMNWSRIKDVFCDDCSRFF